MSFHSIWEPGTGFRWLRAFGLPTLPWAKPFLEQMNFPPTLAENLQILAAIHTTAAEKSNRLWEANKELGYLPELDVAITREFVTEALIQLEENVGSESTKAFKNWAYRNLIRDDFSNAFLAWRVILRRACDKSNWGYKLITPPPCLSVLVPQISDLVCGRHDQELEAKLRLFSPPSEQEANDLGLDMSSDAQIVNEIIRNESTSTALRCIANALSESEYSQIVVWAEAQATEQQIPVNLLLGDMLLRSAGISESWESKL